MRWVTAAALAAAVAGSAWGQTLFQAEPATAVAGAGANQAEPLYAYSLVAVRPPEPRTFLPNDLITIIIRESSRVERDQTLETEKSLALRAEIIKLKALTQFLELRGPDTTESIDADPLLEVEGEFEGEGEYERNDDVTARVTARVLEVKPNGTLLLEARTSVRTDDEVQTITLSGYCRTEDVGPTNTVQSSELYDLRLDVQHEGEIRKATEKGLIPRVFESIFSF
jgi:flagellar L-ring protein precursor FlgH